jgi:hypothetical protein
MGLFEMLKGKKRPEVDSDEIQPGELIEAGVEIQRGDKRLKEGITRSNLSAQEREKLDALRNKKKGS